MLKKLDQKLVLFSEIMGTDEWQTRTLTSICPTVAGRFDGCETQSCAAQRVSGFGDQRRGFQVKFGRNTQASHSWSLRAFSGHNCWMAAFAVEANSEVRKTWFRRSRAMRGDLRSWSHSVLLEGSSRYFNLKNTDWDLRKSLALKEANCGFQGNGDKVCTRTSSDGIFR